jgi:hypothetical protein
MSENPRYIVRATLVNGQPFYCRAGRGWAGGAGTEIEVLPQEGDPMVANKREGLPPIPDPLRVGQKSFAILKADPRLTIHAVGGEAALAANVPELEARLSAAAKAQESARETIAALQAEKKRATEELERAQAALLKATDSLKIAETRAESAEQAAGRLTQERDDLVKQLDELTKPAVAPEGKARSKRV